MRKNNKTVFARMGAYETSVWAQDLIKDLSGIHNAVNTTLWKKSPQRPP